MPAPWLIDPAQFDGGKFAARYGLNAWMNNADFWAVSEADGMYLYLRAGVTIPDDPPVFDAPTAPDKYTVVLSPDGTKWMVNDIGILVRVS